MSLEATMILLDNSDWARNGDYVPSRWEAQYEAVTYIAQSKFQSHPENGVGLITMAGKQVEVLLTPTTENEKVLANLYGIKLKDRIKLKASISIAQLALKHRLNKNQRQKICVFIGSPVSEDENQLIQLAKKLKKNSVAVDIINIGEMDESHIAKLEKFVQTVSNGDNSHFLNIQPGLQSVSDQLFGTSIMGGQQHGGANQNAMGGGGGQGMDQNAFGDFDPNMDPEMAMAIRISIEEEKERQKRIQEQKEKEQEQNKMDEEVKEEPQQNQQEKMNQKHEKEQNKSNVPKTNEGGQNQNQKQELENEEEMEDELIKRAKEMSLQEDNATNQQNQDMSKKENVQNIQDKEFLQDLLGLIPGLDKNNPELAKTIKDLGLEKQQDQQHKEDKKNDEDKNNQKKDENQKDQK